MDERGSGATRLARRRAPLFGALGLVLVAIAVAYLLIFDAGTESTILFGGMLIVGSLITVAAFLYWRRAPR
jgi:hypothetical protein